MTTLHLGVVDVAYSEKDAKGAATTGEVAEILEDRYHVMRTFLELNEAKIGQWLADSMAGQIENLMMGRPASKLAIPTSKIEERFRDYLAQREWKDASAQRVEAAEQGVSHRKKKPTQKRNARPEFIDTGLYQASFRAWVT